MRHGITRRLTSVHGDRTAQPPMLAPADSPLPVGPGPQQTSAPGSAAGAPPDSAPRPTPQAVRGSARPGGDAVGTAGGPPGATPGDPPADRGTGAGAGAGAGAGSGTPPVPPGAAALAAALAERTRDLQRVKAEYDNYRSRVHRDRLAVREAAVANVLRRFPPVLDALAEAARHGELTGGFLQVAQALDGELAALGLEVFGEAGDAFDPHVHEAVAYERSDQLERPVCTEVIRPGYRVGGHLLRAAEVTVAGPPVPPAAGPRVPEGAGGTSGG
ncbi:nucleotide exchange factor GrpE [Streptomyces coeruleoprunus]|uniref:Protein GrpE n=1 Tax=Streptomyces coeruleoprunus TaxID=285563 RepID=A0ABV9X8U0_9ACTN